MGGVLATALLVAALAVAMSPRPVLAADPFDFRGIPLGTTIEDLRRVRFPEAPGARIICAHDPIALDVRPNPDFGVTDQEAKAGVRVCAAFSFGKVLGNASSVLPAEWFVSPLRIGDMDVRPMFWFVTRPEDAADPEGKSRLYKISMRSNAALFDDMVAAFTRRYGKPASSERGAFTGGRGNRLDNATVTWSRNGTTIRLVRRHHVAQRMLIEYEQAELNPLPRES